MAGVEFDLLSLICTIRFWIISSTTATCIRHQLSSGPWAEIPNVWSEQEDNKAQNGHLIPNVGYYFSHPSIPLKIIK